VGKNLTRDDAASPNRVENRAPDGQICALHPQWGGSSTKEANPSKSSGAKPTSVCIVCGWCGGGEVAIR
jgi:hypothetical protein